MPLQATSGAASYDGFGGGVPVAANYIEDVFSTWLYTGQGAGSSQTITNGIDLSTKGGLVWLKNRNVAYNNNLFDTARGVNKRLFSNSTSAELNTADSLTAFNSNGFTIGTVDSGFSGSGENIASWTFRKQAKFFDVVTYTGNGSGVRTIPHNLGSTPGVAILKKTSTTSDWIVTDPGGAWGFYGAQPLYLNNTNAKEGFNQTGVFSADATSIYVGANTFSTGTNFGSNDSGVTYVAYLFAHNAGGFGLTGTDNVITCGSFVTSNTSGFVNVQLGWEPQWILFKKTTSGGANETINDDWFIADNMRGLGNSSSDVRGLHPNLSAAEGSQGWTPIRITATGFQANTSIDQQDTFVYIAIRRGPMRTPTTGTSVYENTAYTGNGASNRQIGSSVLTDLLMLNNRDATAQSWSTYAQMFFDRLRGDDVSLATASTNAESTSWGSYMDFDMNAGWDTGPTTGQIYLNKTSSTYVSHIFRRAPGFFDVVCYTGNATVGRTVAHNLGVAPELLIVKNRAMADYNWKVYSSALGNTSELCLDLSNGTFTGVSTWNSTTPTSTQFTLSNTSDVNRNATNYVAYLFASCPGVSKVGSYTGNGSSQTINMGFTGGARFFLVKRTDSTGDWWVYDAARGMSGLNDPALRLNSSVAETVSGSDAVSTTSVGLIVSQDSTCNINVNGATYIYLAIA